MKTTAKDFQLNSELLAKIGLKVSRVAELFDTTDSTIYRLIRDGKLKAIKLRGGRGAVRVSSEDLQDFINNSMTG